MPTTPVCVDCIREGVTRYRETPHGGPRSPLCVSHWRARKKATSKAAHARRLVKNFAITAVDYAKLYAAQGGRCYICRKAKGLKRRLAVDHEHNRPGCEHPPEQGCYLCIRCLACLTCNRELLGRYDIAALQRAIEVLGPNPPARKVLLDS